MTKYAYVTVLYGNNIYLAGALVLGYSLVRTKTEFDRVILVTPDVSELYRGFLKKIYTHIISIEYVETNPSLFVEGTRFREVFTKLSCIGLIQYQKIILLDIDMIVTKNIDHVFKLSAPAASLKHFNLPYGQKVPSSMICQDNRLVGKPCSGRQPEAGLSPCRGKPCSGRQPEAGLSPCRGSINAGFMLLEPNLEEWNDIQQDILSEHTHRFKYPEQEYISLRYCNKWTAITFNYNFQFGLTKRVKKLHYKADDIYVIHYSSSYKPWNLLVTDEISIEEKAFSERHKKYYDLWMAAYNSIKEIFKNQNINLPF